MASAPDLTAVDQQTVEAARADAPSEALLSLVAETFEALGDPTRARVLYALRGRRLCVRDLAILAGVSESAASHQLRLLRDRRLVRAHRAGNLVYYSVADEHVAALLREAEYHADHVHQGIPDHPYQPTEQRTPPAIASADALSQPNSSAGSPEVCR